MNIVEQAKAILFTPKISWDDISTEDQSTSSLITTYFFPLVMIPVIATFVSYGIIGYRVPFFGYVSSYELGIRQALSMLLSTTIGVFLTAFIIDILAPSFGAEKNYSNALKLVIYSYTPSLIGGVFYLYYATSVLAVLMGLYGLYILYLGLKPMMKVSDEKQTTYFVISLVTIIGVFFVLSLILATVIIGSAALYL